jgi:hypothetical protein
MKYGEKKVDSSAQFAKAYRQLYLDSMDRMLQTLGEHASTSIFRTRDYVPPTPKQVAQWEREAADRLARNREEWRQQECVFVVYEGTSADGDCETQLSWWGSEAEAQAEVDRLKAAEPRQDYDWQPIPKGTLCR